MKSDKWKFCPEKKCYYCKRDLEEEDLVDKDLIYLVTKCPFCFRSFVD